MVNRVARVAGRILDRSTDSSCLSSKPDGLGRGLRFVGAAVLQISIHRQVGCAGNHPAILDDGVAADGRAAQRIGQAQTGGRESLETDRGKQLRRTGVPRVWDDEGAGSLMQRAK